MRASGEKTIAASLESLLSHLHTNDIGARGVAGVLFWTSTRGRMMRPPRSFTLHVNGAGATAGCVSVEHTALDAILRILKPAASPRIVVTTRSALASA